MEKETKFEAQGAIVRSGAQWMEYGETNSKYFFNLEKVNARNKIMSTVINEAGKRITDPKEVLNEQKKFYENLYTSSRRVSFRMEHVPEKKVTDVERELMEQDISIKELKIALKTTKRAKYPGPDGISSDWYIVFINKIGSLLVDAFNYALKVGRMHPSSRNGIISLIPKKNKSPSLLANWRPIILLCTDYKLLAKIISNRIRKNLDSIIGKSQNGFIPGRNINTCLRSTLDVLSYTEQKQLNAVLIAIDFQKAFDKCEYHVLDKVMKLFGFGPKICHTVQVLFKDINLCTLNNGHSSGYLSPSRGLFQGHPYSPTGFILIIELLAINLKNNEKVHGIKIGKVTHLLSMFADDANIFTQNTIESGQAIQYELRHFQSITGLTINYNKTEVYRMGAAKKAEAKQYVMSQIKWTDKPITVLWILITENPQELVRINIEPLIKKARESTSLAIWINLFNWKNLSYQHLSCISIPVPFKCFAFSR